MKKYKSTGKIHLFPLFAILMVALAIIPTVFFGRTQQIFQNNAYFGGLPQSGQASNNLTLIPVCNNSPTLTGKFNAINVSWVPLPRATAYVLDWFFTTNGQYNECQKQVSGTTSTTISAADTGAATQKYGTQCFAQGVTIGATYNVVSPYNSQFSNPVTLDANICGAPAGSNLTLRPVCRADALTGINANWVALPHATLYVLDWFFTTNGQYNECQKQVSTTRTTISSADNGTAIQKYGSRCFIPGVDIGASYNVVIPYNTLFSDPATTLRAGVCK